jgi:uncharacterized membrane protein
MWEFLQTPFARFVIDTAILLVLVAVGYYFVRRFRDRISEHRQTASDWLTNFREMHHEGDITDAEFRTIKTVLGEQIQTELNDTKENG